MSDFLQIFYVSNARRFGFSKRRWLLFCLFNQSELTSLVTQCRVSEKMNMNSADHFSPVVCCGEAVLTCVQVR